MENNLPVIIARLRCERKITQKQAAADLGISQSLLSHYENGIRECSLDFLCRAADYYGVTTDYLLGRTDSRGAEQADKGLPFLKNEESRYLVLNSERIKVPSRKDIFESLYMLFELISMTGSEALEAETALYHSVGVYRLYRAIYRNSSGSDSGLFPTPMVLAMNRTGAAYIQLEMQIKSLISSENKDGTVKSCLPKSVRTDEDYLMEHYPDASKSLENILKAVEATISAGNGA